MPKVNFEQLLDAGVHFGHLKRKWNPSMAPYIFMERNGIHIIDLHKTVLKIEEAAGALKNIAKSGRKILFVATKKQAKDIVSEEVKNINMPYVTERWPGGMLTNFPTIRRAVKKMSSIDKMHVDGTFTTLSKRERLQVTRKREKLEKNLGSISDLSRLPAAIFVVDVMKENIAVKEAIRLGIPVFAMVDTNSDPKPIDFIIPANDDASKSIQVIVHAMCEAIKEGIAERGAEKESNASAKGDGDFSKGGEERKSGRRTRAKRETPKVEAKLVKTEAPKTEATPVVETPVKTEAPKAEATPVVEAKPVKTDTPKEEK